MATLEECGLNKLSDTNQFKERNRMRSRDDIQSDAPRKWCWYQGVLFYAGVQAVSFGLGKLVKSVRQSSEPKLTEQIVGNESYDEFYNGLKQPVFAPPDWSFAPAWTLNNALAIWGLLQVLNMPRRKPGRDEFLFLQAAFWVTFVGFNPLYFGLRSPILGALDTNVGLALTAASEYVALARLKDTKTALSQSTTLLWLVLAAATATTVAAWNEDEFLNSRPLVEPSPQSSWVKQ